MPRISSFVYLRSSRIASEASWNLRANVCVGVSIRTFFTTCCEIVEAPCSISPDARFVIAARIRPGKSSAPCS
jgi:hypothetical protein